VSRRLEPFLVLGALALVSPARGGEGDGGPLDEVRRVLTSRCVSCHGPDERSGGLRLDSREAVLKGGEHGPAVVPGDAAGSLLLRAVHRETEKLAMPPDEALSEAEIATLEHWIEGGAVWPNEPAAKPRGESGGTGERIGDAWHDPRNPIVRIFGGERLDLWSFQPVRRIDAPTVKGEEWVRTPIDRFVLARIEADGASPAAEADRRTLIRRVTFDLTGVPPTPEAVARFVAEASPGAYDRLVDRLLASPAYGEHVARMWLDVVRFSDSNGFDWDEYRPQAWRFRDYVVRSFNADKPFDRFVVEQLAGDELLDGPPEDEEERDALIATGYLRLGPQDNAASLFNEQARARSELMADLVDTTGGAMLGLTFACCRCHDHKYDPLSQADHFRIRAFFEPVTFGDDVPLDLAAEQEAIRRHNAEIDEEVGRLRADRDGLLASAAEKLREEKSATLTEEVRALLAREQESGSGGEAAAELKKRIEPSDKEVRAALEPAVRERVESIEKAVKEAEGRRRSFQRGLLMTDAAGEVGPTHVLAQGDYREPREAVSAGFVSALDPNPATLDRPVNSNTHGRRLTLARWIVSPENPFTARVFVNRVWQSLFGRGLVATPNDCGLGGAAPTHPELLDRLASDFVVGGGWSVKRLHRAIVTSAAYRQGLGAAGQGDLYAGRPPRRLSAEQLRDSLLAVSGLLTDKSGGPPVWPELPADILQANPALLDDNETRTKGWYPSPRPEANARSVYLIQKRTVRVPLLETFDLPENATSCGRRDVSTVAPQALALLNSPLAAEAAAAFAERVRVEAGERTGAQVERAYALALQRAPTADERAACVEFAGRRGLIELCRVLLNVNEFAYLD